MGKVTLHSAASCSPFFRLYDRMRRQQVGNTFGDVWFDVDIENLARGRTNLMAMILNRGKEPWTSYYASKHPISDRRESTD